MLVIKVNNTRPPVRPWFSIQQNRVELWESDKLFVFVRFAYPTNPISSQTRREVNRIFFFIGYTVNFLNMIGDVPWGPITT